MIFTSHVLRPLYKSFGSVLCGAFPPLATQRAIVTLYILMLFDTFSDLTSHHANTTFYKIRGGTQTRVIPIFDPKILFISTYINKNVVLIPSMISKLSVGFITEVKLNSIIKYEKFKIDSKALSEVKKIEYPALIRK